MAVRSCGASRRLSGTSASTWTHVRSRVSAATTRSSGSTGAHTGFWPGSPLKAGSWSTAIRRICIGSAAGGSVTATITGRPIRAGPVALGALRGQELHASSECQAQGGQLGPALRGDASGRAPRGAGGHHGRRGRGPVTVSCHQEDLATHAEAFECLQELLTPGPRR